MPSPSISTVTVRVICSVLGSFWSTDARTLLARILEPTFTVEIEGESKPALVAEWVTRLVYG